MWYRPNTGSGNRPAFAERLESDWKLVDKGRALDSLLDTFPIYPRVIRCCIDAGRSVWYSVDRYVVEMELSWELSRRINSCVNSPIPFLLPSCSLDRSYTPLPLVILLISFLILIAFF